MTTRKTSPLRLLANAAPAAGLLDLSDDLASIRARVRLLEVALLGGGGGASLGEGTYLEAIIQGVQDVANGLDALAERIKA